MCRYLKYALVNVMLLNQTMIPKNWVTNNMIFIHYSGKFKPWNVKGILDKRSSYYQVVYRKLFKESYQVSYNYKKNALIDLINGFRRRRVFDLEFPISFIFLVLKSLFK